MVSLLVGVGLLSGALYTGYRQYAIVATWPTVEAEVVESELYRERNSLVRKSGRTVTFRYHVAGAEYTEAAASSYVTSSYKVEQERGEKYAPGTRHSIRYNPADPRDIRFDAGYHIGFFLAPVVLGFLGLVFVFMGLAVRAILRR